jgi:hypothetical protein
MGHEGWTIVDHTLTNAVHALVAVDVSLQGVHRVHQLRVKGLVPGQNNGDGKDAGAHDKEFRDGGYG